MSDQYVGGEIGIILYYDIYEADTECAIFHSIFLKYLVQLLKNNFIMELIILYGSSEHVAHS